MGNKGILRLDNNITSVSSVLKGKLAKLYDEFTYKGEKFVMTCYGGKGRECYCYYDSDNHEIRMDYTLKRAEYGWKGLDEIQNIEVLY